MNYRTDRYGNQLSILGFGCMRFPQTLGKIDMKETEAEKNIGEITLLDRFQRKL